MKLEVEEFEGSAPLLVDSKAAIFGTLTSQPHVLQSWEVFPNFVSGAI